MLLPLQQRAWVPLALLLVSSAPPSAVSEPLSVVEDLLNPIGEVVNPVVEQLKPVVEVVAGLAPIPGKLLGTISPHTSKLNGLLQSGLLQNSLSQFTSDIVTSLTSVVAEIANALLPVPKYLRPDKEAPKFGLVGEAYNVTTSDGYILGVFRVRNGTCGSYRAVVAIPPGILSNAASFIYIKENSLVYRLARRCFDVWLLTFRGYLFGRGHTHLSDTSSKFWDFYAYHWGAIDLPAQLEFVSNKTGSTGIRYVGSDQAATALFFMNHVHGERYQKMMDSTFIMAPIGYLAHLRSLVFDMLAVGRDALTAAGVLTLHNELAFMNPTVHSVLFNLCGRISPITCYYVFQILGGKSTEINYPMFPYAFANLLDSTSIVGFNYYLQLVGKNKTMRFYDYGPTENMKRYGRPTPEDVDLTKTTVKCNFFALGSDSVTVPEDVLDTYLALPKCARSTYQVLKQFNGVSPFVPVNSTGLYGPIIRLIELSLKQGSPKCRSG